MLVVVFFLLCVLSVPLAGGQLTELAHVRLRMLWPLLLAATLQIAVSALPAHEPTWVHAAFHIGSYLLAGAFVLANRRIPGILVVGFGGALNLVAIAANGGVMPVVPSAFGAAGLVNATGVFHNSAVVASPKLAFLGDILAVPSPLPFHNVFSVGDVCIAIGAAVALHRVCKSRLPSGTGQFAQLRHHHDFVRLWGAQAASNFGDWVYSLAVATSLATRGGGPESFAFLLILQVAPSTLVGALGGPLVDRMSRRRLMLGADILRCAAVLTLFVAGTPSRLHLYGVAFGLGLFGALFQPSFQASLPNLVPRERLVAANALVSTTFHVAVMAGPIIGGLIVSHLGIRTAFVINAGSFAVSAVLVARSRVPQRSARESSRESPLRALAESVRYIGRTPLVRRVFGALALIMLASAIKTPLEPLFILRTLGRRPEALGLVGGAWGVGMVLGSLGAPAAARRWHRERLLAMSIALVGVAVLIASQQWLLSPVLMLWFLAGMGNGSGTVFYETLLQERVPDVIRGRVLAASEAVLDGAFLVGALLAAVIGQHLGVRLAFAASGVLFIAAALLTRVTIDSSPVVIPEAVSEGAGRD